MSSGAMFYAVSLDDLSRGFAGREHVECQELLQALEATGHFLTNSAHMPAPLDDLLALDNVLKAAGYPRELRYARLLCGRLPLPLAVTEELPLVGCVVQSTAAAATTEAALRGVPRSDDAWQSAALEELFENLRAVVALGLDLVGVYS